MYTALPISSEILKKENPWNYAGEAISLFEKIYKEAPRLSGEIPFVGMRWEDLSNALAYKQALRFANPLHGAERFAEISYLPIKFAPAVMQAVTEEKALPVKLEEMKARTDLINEQVKNLIKSRIPHDLASEFLQFLVQTFPSLFQNFNTGGL